MKDAKVQIVRHFRAPPAAVFEACSDPRQLASWLGPFVFRVTVLEADVRAGGSLKFEMTDGDQTLAVEGQYEVVDPPHRLVHTWRWTQGSDADGTISRITYELEDVGGGTRLTFTQDGLGEDETSSHQWGWEEALAKLERLLVSSHGNPT